MISLQNSVYQKFAVTWAYYSAHLQQAAGTGRGSKVPRQKSLSPYSLRRTYSSKRYSSEQVFTSPISACTLICPSPFFEVCICPLRNRISKKKPEMSVIRIVAFTFPVLNSRSSSSPYLVFYLPVPSSESPFWDANGKHLLGTGCRLTAWHGTAAPNSTPLWMLK